MSGLIPVDIPGVVLRALKKQQRPPDGLLHPSSDLIGSLRHAQLTAAGAPKIESPIASQMPLLLGTYLHTWLGEQLEAEGIPFMREVNLQHWLPEGWNGTADFVFFDPEKDGWVLTDLKSQKGESYKFTRDGGAKDEHIWQVSAYWWALVEMGLPMVNGFGIIYLPKNDTTDKNERVELLVQECDPLPRELVWDTMEERWALTQAYLAEINAERERWSEATGAHPMDYPSYDDALNDKLAPVQERIQKMWWSAKTNTWDVKLVPHWSAGYCPFPNELCDCSEAGTTKIGHWKLLPPKLAENRMDNLPQELVYEARKGYEDYEPEVKPTPKEVKKRAGKSKPSTSEGDSGDSGVEV